MKASTIRPPSTCARRCAGNAAPSNTTSSGAEFSRTARQGGARACRAIDVAPESGRSGFSIDVALYETFGGHPVDLTKRFAVDGDESLSAKRGLFFAAGSAAKVLPPGMLMVGARASVAPSVAHEAETNIAEEKRREAVATIPSPLRMALRSGIGAPPSGLVLSPGRLDPQG